MTERVKTEITLGLMWDPLGDVRNIQQVYAWIVHDRQTLDYYLDLTYRGRRLWKRIPHPLHMRLFSDVYYIARPAQLELASWVGQFVMSVDATLRGGYA